MNLKTNPMGYLIRDRGLMANKVYCWQPTLLIFVLLNRNLRQLNEVQNDNG